jgi:hypothetical protein
MQRAMVIAHHVAALHHAGRPIGAVGIDQSAREAVVFRV